MLLDPRCSIATGWVALKYGDKTSCWSDPLGVFRVNLVRLIVYTFVVVNLLILQKCHGVWFLYVLISKMALLIRYMVSV